MNQAQNNANILARDIFGVALATFVLVAFLLMRLAESEASDAEADMPGNLMATISWPAGDFDVDIWLDGPGEPIPVGYSNKGGLLWNLLRDDLGRVPDYTEFNFETAYTRGLPPGDYRVNVHCFRCPQVPLEVNLELIKRGAPSVDGKAPAEVLGVSTITLYKNHEEKTGLAFTVDSDGNVPRESMNTLFEPLRSASK